MSFKAIEKIEQLPILDVSKISVVGSDFLPDSAVRHRPNSPAPLTDDWKVTDNSSVNFHDVFFFIFCYNLAKNEEKHIMEIYG